MAAIERRLLIGLTGVQALMATIGGIGLMVNGMGMPLSYLRSSAFSSYVWPGIILLVALGVTNGLATVLLLRKHTWALTSVAVGAMAALGWIVGELYATPVVNWMQLLVAALAAAQLTLVYMLLGIVSEGRGKLWIG